ncbi:MAG: glycosyltransferase family 4 protein [Bacteroidales bacterium]|nr:glycosyltransferase family 4 protein [Bacteroidales bacterium]
MSKSRILFILHLPPPVHGAALVGSAIRESGLVNESFDARYINLSASVSLEQVGRFSLGKVRAVFRLLSQVRHTVREWKPDLVYITPSSTMPGLLKDALTTYTVRRKGCKTILHFHNKGVSARKDHFVDDWLYRMLFQDASVILLSRLLYPDIRKYVPEERVSYCPNGVSVPAVIHRTGDPSRILFLSNMIRSKGVSVLVDACRLLRERGIPFRCSLVGALSADYPGDSLAVEIREKGLEGCVVYEGPRYGDEKWKAFSEADVFAFPTFYPDECFPLAVLEAMGAGLPVVTTTEGALPDIIRDGKDGFICPKQDPVSLADALARLLSDPGLRTRMGEIGRTRYEACFTMDRFERNIVDILERHIDA